MTAAAQHLCETQLLAVVTAHEHFVLAVAGQIAVAAKRIQAVR
jgi:hypothetical protein